MGAFPSLLFFTTFSLFIYFFARVVIDEDVDSGTNLLKPFFIIFNIFTYLAFFIIAIYNNGWIYYNNPVFLKAITGLFGVVYIIFTIFMINYGTKLYLILSTLSEHNDPDEKLLLQKLSIRVILITVMLSLIFAVRSLYNLLYTWGLSPTYYPDGLNPIQWEAIFILAFECIPIITILLISFQGDKKSFLFGGANNLSQEISENETYEEAQSFGSEDVYGNFNPNLNEHLLQERDQTVEKEEEFKDLDPKVRSK
mmetsp:Transcript_34937/g.33979  ORF Transcript_34937/g.33979 Transcript_34937/m.33979 type:complete len:254 (+) Transcript_34937:230-991(+)